MLMYGESYCKSFLKNDTIILSLTSYDESLLRLNLLMPPRELGKFLDRDFDIVYANYLLGDNEVFLEFFSIIINLYYGKDVFIAASLNDWSENLVESLCKLIQQRYGYNAIEIRSEEDYLFAINNFNVDFNDSYGILNLDQDRNRFSYLSENKRLLNGQPDIVIDEMGVHKLFNNEG